MHGWGREQQACGGLEHVRGWGREQQACFLCPWAAHTVQLRANYLQQSAERGSAAASRAHRQQAGASPR